MSFANMYLLISSETNINILFKQIFVGDIDYYII